MRSPSTSLSLWRASELLLEPFTLQNAPKHPNIPPIWHANSFCLSASPLCIYTWIQYLCHLVPVCPSPPLHSPLFSCHFTADPNSSLQRGTLELTRQARILPLLQSFRRCLSFLALPGTGMVRIELFLGSWMRSRAREDCVFGGGGMGSQCGDAGGW